MKYHSFAGVLIAIVSLSVFAGGNTTNQSVSKAKKMLMRDVYTQSSQRRTIYCNAVFDSKKNITLPTGFHTNKYVKRSKRVEIEHVVPAENFGRTFSEWRDGHPQCVNSKGKSFKGRRCAEKINTEYRYMQSDMFNLYPAVGAVNAMRSNYNFVMLSGGVSDFGSCNMQIENRKAQPPKKSRGMIARSYLYMDITYKRYSMSKSQRNLMLAWDKQYPVNDWECERSSKIERLQGNFNLVMTKRCNSM